MQLDVKIVKIGTALFRHQPRRGLPGFFVLFSKVRDMTENATPKNRNAIETRLDKNNS